MKNELFVTAGEVISAPAFCDQSEYIVIGSSSDKIFT